MRHIGFSIGLLLSASIAWGQNLPSPESDAETRRGHTRQAAVATTQAWATDAGGQTKAIGPFVRVEGDKAIILGEATGLGGADPVEFFLVGPNSGKAYEALAISYASAGDIDAALRAIGLTPGHGVDPEHMLFFPRGPRVEMTFGWTAPAGPMSATTGQLIGRSRAAEPGAATRPSRAGLVYVGSPLAKAGADGKPRLAADLGDVGSIASSYNEPSTLLDVPRLAPQGIVYRQQLAAASLRKGEAVTITITVLKDVHQMDQRIVFVTVPNSAPPAVAVQMFALESPGPSMMRPMHVKQLSLEDAVRQILETPVTDELFLHPEIAPDVPLGEVARFYRALSAASTLEKCEIEAPKAGEAGEAEVRQIFYQAFLPDEANRDPAERFFPSAELDLTGAKPLLRTYDDPPTVPGIQPKWKITEQTVATPGDIAAAVAGPLKPADPDDRRPLFIFAPPTLTHAELLKWIAPIRSQYPVIWVYLPK